MHQSNPLVDGGTGYIFIGNLKHEPLSSLIKRSRSQMPLPDSDLKKLEYLKHEFKKYSTPVLTWIRKGSMAKLDLAAIFVAFIVLPAVMSDTPLEFGM